MPTRFFYVYALKDPRSTPARAFYVGKGTGSRAFYHLVMPDATAKYQRIRKIRAKGLEPLVAVLADDLDEAQALKLEAELISAFGTEQTGGILTHAVVPSGLGGKSRIGIVVPQGAIERAQLGLQFLKGAVSEFVQANPNGVTNADTASMLGLRSDYQGRQKDSLTYSLLGLLLRDRRICRTKGGPVCYRPQS